MALSRERKQRRAHIKHAIISPSESGSVILFLLGAIIGGMTFGFGFALGQQMLKKIEHRQNL